MLNLDRCSYCNSILDHNDPCADIRSYMDKYQLCFGCYERMQQFIDENMNILVELYIQPERSKREDVIECCCQKCDCPNWISHDDKCSAHK